MRDLTTVLQELSRHGIGCRVESVVDSFRIGLNDDVSGTLRSFTIAADEIPAAGEMLWDLARQHCPILADEPGGSPLPAPSVKVVPLSRLVGRAIPEGVFPMDDPLTDIEVLSFAVLSANDRFETVWYANTLGEVREEVVGRREGWRQSARFRHAEERTADEFRRLYVA